MRILWRGENRISITPFQPLPESQGLQSVKAETGRRWPMTELLDVLKEAALDTNLCFFVELAFYAKIQDPNSGLLYSAC